MISIVVSAHTSDDMLSPLPALFATFCGLSAGDLPAAGFGDEVRTIFARFYEPFAGFRSPTARIAAKKSLGILDALPRALLHNTLALVKWRHFGHHSVARHTWPFRILFGHKAHITRPSQNRRCPGGRRAISPIIFTKALITTPASWLLLRRSGI